MFALLVARTSLGPIKKDDRCTEYTLLCSLAMDKSMTCFYTCPLSAGGFAQCDNFEMVTVYILFKYEKM